MTSKSRKNLEGMTSKFSIPSWLQILSWTSQFLLLMATQENCSNPRCPQGSVFGKCMDGEQLHICICKPGYYRGNISDLRSPCYRFECPEESVKIENITHPSVIPTCVCDTSKGFWGDDPNNCHKKGCPSHKKLVRKTGVCGCDPGSDNRNGICIVGGGADVTSSPGADVTFSPGADVTFSPGADLTSPPGADVNASSSAVNSGHGLNPIVIAGISVGAVIGVVIAIVIVIVFVRKLRRGRKKNKEKQTEEGVNSLLTGDSSDSNQGTDPKRSSTPVSLDENNSCNEIHRPDLAKEPQTVADLQEVHHHYTINADVVQVGDSNTVKYNKLDTQERVR